MPTSKPDNIAKGTVLHTAQPKPTPHDHAYEEVIGELTITPKGLGGSIHFENLVYLRCTHPGCPSLKFPSASKDFIEAEVNKQKQANAEEIDKKMAEISSKMLKEGPRVKVNETISRSTPGLGKLAAALASQERHDNANSLLRSALAIASRQGCDTNWDAFLAGLHEELYRQANVSADSTDIRKRLATTTAKTFKIAPEETE